MDIKKFLPEGKHLPHSSNFTIVVHDAVGGYEIRDFKPQECSVTVREGIDSYTVEEILRLEHPGFTETQIETIREEILRRYINNIGSFNIYPAMDFIKGDVPDEGGSLHDITFWCPDNLNWEESITKYLNLFKEDLLCEWDDVSGDDSYFDYLPSYTHILWQLCHVFQAKDIWNDFIEKLTEIDEAALTEALYNVKI